MKSCTVLLSVVVLAFSAGAADAADEHGHMQVTRERIFNQSAIPIYGYRVVQEYPHDRASYTAGLVLEGGIVYESTGLYGKSKLRRWELRSGRTLNEVDLDARYFGEGVTVFRGAAYQLTYLANTGFIYDPDTLQRRESFRYLSQGWGLTHDGKRLLMSDGSSAILRVNPQSFEVEGSIFVSDNVGPVGFLNELEYVDDKLYANVWLTTVIAIIAPETGKITGWIDLTGLNPEPNVLVNPYVLNGIAYNKDSGRLLVTGKCWPNVYEIELVERPRP